MVLILLPLLPPLPSLGLSMSFLTTFFIRFLPFLTLFLYSIFFYFSVGAVLSCSTFVLLHVYVLPVCLYLATSRILLQQIPQQIWRTNYLSGSEPLTENFVRVKLNDAAFGFICVRDVSGSKPGQHSVSSWSSSVPQMKFRDYVKIRHHHFLPRTFQFIMRFVYHVANTVQVTEPLNNYKGKCKVVPVHEAIHVLEKRNIACCSPDSNPGLSS